VSRIVAPCWLEENTVTNDVEEMLSRILTAIDVVAEMAIGTDQLADDVAACEIKLRQLLARTGLILHLIEARRPRPTTVTGRGVNGRVN
jgi:hypothetical protein